MLVSLLEGFYTLVLKTFKFDKKSLPTVAPIAAPVCINSPVDGLDLTSSRLRCQRKTAMKPTRRRIVATP